MWPGSRRSGRGTPAPSHLLHRWTTCPMRSAHPGMRQTGNESQQTGYDIITPVHSFNFFILWWHNIKIIYKSRRKLFVWSQNDCRCTYFVTVWHTDMIGFQAHPLCSVAWFVLTGSGQNVLSHGWGEVRWSWTGLQTTRALWEFIKNITVPTCVHKTQDFWLKNNIM